MLSGRLGKTGNNADAMMQLAQWKSVLAYGAGQYVFGGGGGGGGVMKLFLRQIFYGARTIRELVDICVVQAGSVSFTNGFIFFNLHV